MDLCLRILQLANFVQRMFGRRTTEHGIVHDTLKATEQKIWKWGCKGGCEKNADYVVRRKFTAHRCNEMYV